MAGLDLDPWQQDALDRMLSVRADGKWACFEYGEIVSRQNGKGSILEARILAGLFILGEDLILWSAHLFKTATEGFRRCKTLLDRLENRGVIAPGDVKVTNANGDESIEIVSTGQRLRFVARSKGSGRGFSADVIIIDEAFAYTMDEQAALLPTLSARKNPQIIYTSSPPLDPATGDVLFSLRNRGLAGGDDSLGWRDWGAAGDLDHLDDVDLSDTATWQATNPAMGVRITEETIRREQRAMSREKFACERLGIWPVQSQDGGAIDPSAWAALADPESKREGPVTIAVDIAPTRDYSAIALYGVRADGVGHLQLVDYRPGTEWVVDRLVELHAALDPVAIAMGRGAAASLEVDLNKRDLSRPETADKPRQGDLAVTNATEMSAATGQMLDAVKQATLRHKSQRELDSSVTGAKVRQTGDVLAWARKESATDTSPLVAASLARWAYESRAHLVMAAKYDLLTSIW